MVGTAAAVIITCGIVAGAVTGLIPSAVSRKAEPCVSCGTVVAVRQVQVDGQASGVGAVAGGVTGAVVGNQLGRGDGRAPMTVLGAAGGAFAGHQIEKHVKKSTAWRITVRMEDEAQTRRTLSQSTPPAVAVGERVRVVEGQVVALAAAK